jgi:farnesyl-diphosphate farnesyltransferase
VKLEARATAFDILATTSRTFFIPIAGLPVPLREAVASGYLCLRAIDEIEDHPDLDNVLKARLLRWVALQLQAPFNAEDLERDLRAQAPALPEVSVRIGEWALLPPHDIAPRIWDATASMAARMAEWADCSWEVQTEADLDRYTFGVAGAVGLLLSDLWAWHDGTQTDRANAIGFGRGLQAVNILRNRRDDLERGVNYFPAGWSTDEMHAYARRNLVMANAYTGSLSNGPARDFCSIPLALASATLDALARGEVKLDRHTVQVLVSQATSDARRVRS